MATVIGNGRSNRLVGTSHSDLIDGRGGNDILKGLGQDDTLFGGNGNDRLKGGSGNDTLFGENGNDTLNGGVGDDTVSGGDGNDLLRGGSGTNFLDGGAGDDLFLFTRGIDEIQGGEGIDTLSFAEAIGAVTVDDQDILLDGELHGFVDAEIILGSPFDDQFRVFQSLVRGGDGNDSIQGENPEGSLFGEAGDDTLRVGQNGGGFLFGDDGNDTLFAGAGTQMTGGASEDTFSIDYRFYDLEGFSSEGSVILDFTKGDDLIEFVGGDPEAFLTNEDDIWTVHSPNDADYQLFVGDPEAVQTISFQIVGVTELEEGVDFTFDTLFV